MNKNEFDLVELQAHLEALKNHSKKDLPEDVKQNLINEISFIEKKLMEIKWIA